VANELKELWLIEGAGHVNFHAFATAAYEEKSGRISQEKLGQSGR
jgi:hypothetical protein